MNCVRTYNIPVGLILLKKYLLNMGTLVGFIQRMTYSAIRIRKRNWRRKKESRYSRKKNKLYV
jgi:hypothetical protein